MPNSLEFSNLIITKLCHDLAGPINAVHNGVEFMGENTDPSITNKALELISVNAEELVDKLRFFRFLYGSCNQTSEIDFNEVKQSVTDFFKHTNVSISWPHYVSSGDVINLTRTAARLLGNLILLASHALIAGGVISVKIAIKDNHKEMSVVATGHKIKFHEHIDHVFNDPKHTSMKIENIQAHVTMKMAEMIGANIKVQHDHSMVGYVVKMI